MKLPKRKWAVYCMVFDHKHNSFREEFYSCYFTEIGAWAVAKRLQRQADRKNKGANPPVRIFWHVVQRGTR